MRLLVLALLGFLSCVIYGAKSEHEEGLALSEDYGLDESGQSENIPIKQKREAGGRKKQQGRKANLKKDKKKPAKQKKPNSKRNRSKTKNQRKRKPIKGNEKKIKGKSRNRKGNKIKTKNAKNSKPKNKQKGHSKRNRKEKIKKRRQKKKIVKRKEISNKRKSKFSKGKKKSKKKKNQSIKGNQKSGSKRIKSGKEKKKKQSGRALSCSNCVVMLASYSRLFEAKSGVVVRQYKRIKNFEKITGLKMNKKGSFNSSYNSMLSALGGNKTSPNCDGETIGSNSTSEAYKDALSTLETCESTIDANCPSILDSATDSPLVTCNETAFRFRAAFSACLNSSLYSTQEAICGCVEGISTDDVASLKICDTTKQVKKQKQQKKKCIAKFEKCKKAQDTTVEGLDTCKKQYKCGGASNPMDAKEQKDLATKIKDALDATEKCHGEAMASLSLTAGNGDNGLVPSSRSAMHLSRSVRQATDKQGCKELEQLWEAFNKSADATAQKFSDNLKTEPAANTTAILASICARNLTADLAGCAKENKQITVTLTILIVRIRIYIFWCRQWLILIELKITIITVTFGLTPSPPSPAPTPSVATKRTARRRVNEILRNLKSKL